MYWDPFVYDGQRYDFIHLKPKNICVKRKATEFFPEKNIRIFLSYTNHCFTKHFGCDDALFEDSGRFFCTERYEGSKLLPELIPKLLDDNVDLMLTIRQHRESFFYLEEYFMGVNYRLFFDISKSNHPASDIRLKVKSAHPEEEWAESVGTVGCFSFWRVIDSRLNNEKLAYKAQQRRRRR
ncbi:hypothetical protein JEP11_17630 [Proteus mirabilis]|nr:hypothetical protein [Proteus mirabilis]HEJ9418606.1 hypothetical protein [Proteus mirabilis]HEJ9542912.1 hypothetical protein [Proteus mirabilis]